MSAAQILKSMRDAPKLGKPTYNRWSTHFLDALSLFDIDDYLVVEKAELNSRGLKNIPETDKTVQKQDKNIRVAMSHLVPDEIFHLVDSSFTSKKCWDNLRQYYCPNSTEDIDDLLGQYWGLQVEDDVEVDEFVQKLSEIRSKISLLNSQSTPSDTSMKKRILGHFIKCCGGFYMSTAISLRDPSITLQAAIASIRASQTVYQELHQAPVVAIAQNVSNNRPNGKGKTCAHCKRNGHLRESCFLWLETPDGTKWAAKNPEKAAKSMRIKERLSHRKGKKKNFKKEPNIKDNNEVSEPGAWVLEEHALISHGNSKGLEIVLDTGATNHVFHDRSLFLTIASCNKHIVNASGQLIAVSGAGRVQFRVYDYLNNYSSKIITMEDVLYVPSCTKNLVSGIQLFNKGLKIETSNEGLSVLSSKGVVIATAKPKGGLFCFNTIPYTVYNDSSSKAPENGKILISPNQQKSTSELIHHRFAHVGSHLLDKICVSDLKLPSLTSKDLQDFHLDKENLKSCDVCNSCKQIEKINRGPLLTSPVVLQLIHSDTWGKCRYPGIFGSLYFVTFTDDCSRESEVYLMKNKTEVSKHFQLYKETKERQSGQTIKAMRFDGGSEYKPIKFNGIIQQISAPYTQHQNGVAERLNRTLITMARCMLSHARLPFRFWDAAVLTACYLRNRLPSRPHALTPFELMNSSAPKYSHLKVWGCTCYVLIDEKDPQRYKLSPTSRKGIFVGYCESSTQYRIYIPSKPGINKIIISANVNFLEDTFWDMKEPLFDTTGDGETPLNPNSILIGSDDDSEDESDLDLNNPNDSLPQTLNSPELDPDELIDHNDRENNFDAAELNPDVEIPVLRRSSRVRRPIEPHSAWQPRTHALQIGGDIAIPQSYLEAISGPEKEHWRSAIDTELNSLDKKQVFKPVTHIPHGRKPIGSRWVFVIKSDGRFRARLVAKGFSQVSGIDYFDIYAPTLRMDSLRILLAISAFRDWEIHQIDVETAYLEGDLNEEIFMKCPEGMKGTNYVQVVKSLYGLKQSGRAWNEKLDSKLTSLNFRKSQYDRCIYIHTDLQVVVGVYVDDLVVCGKILNQVISFKENLSSFFPIKDLGELKTIIGWRIVRDRKNRTLKISQSHYLRDKVQSYGLNDARTHNSPLNGYDGILPAKDDEQLADESAYASAIGSLGYAANSTRPDISFATSQLGSFNSSPVIRHWNTVCRVLRYIKGSENFCIKYCFGPISQTLDQEHKAVMYSDSDFASDVTTRRSVSGYILMIGGGPVCWQSRRQKSISTSTAEAEYVALFEASKQAIWVHGFLSDLRVAKELIDENGLLTFTDNQSALAIAKGANSTKTKHIDIAYHFVRDCVNKGTINIKYIPTTQMLADILTKPLPFSKAGPLIQQIFS